MHVTALACGAKSTKRLRRPPKEQTQEGKSENHEEGKAIQGKPAVMEVVSSNGTDSFRARAIEWKQ